MGLLSFGALVATSWARVEIAYDSQLELSTGTDGKLRPSAVSCTEGENEIIVTESRQMGIHIFNADGIEVFTTSRFAKLVGPLDADVDNAGRTVHLTRISGRNHQLRRLNLYGEPDSYTAEVPSEDFLPRHLIATRDGHYLSLDAESGLLVKNDSRTGAIIWTANLTGEASDKASALHLGRPVEARDGRLAIPGGELHRVLILDANGEFVTSFGRFGSAPGRLVFPVAAVFGPEDTLLVLDRMRHKILVYGAEYKFQSEYGSLGARPGQFYHPVSMAGSDDGHLYVAQGYLGRVQVFNILTSEGH